MRFCARLLICLIVTIGSDSAVASDKASSPRSPQGCRIRSSVPHLHSVVASFDRKPLGQ